MTAVCACPGEWPDWDGRDIDLGGEWVYELPIATFLHMPFGYEIYVARQADEIRKLELQERWPGLVLTQTGLFGGKILRLLAGGETPSRRVQRLPNPYRAHAVLHRGDVGTMRPVIQKLQAELLDKGRMPKELLLAYLTCPHCRDSKGGDKVMILRRWVESPTLSKRRAPRS